MPTSNLWVYKCNVNSAAQGEWEWFFEEWSPGDWGGTRTTRDPISLRIIREEIRSRDLVLAWQTDKRKMMGLCEVTKLEPKGRKRDLDFEIHLRSLKRFEPPVPRDQLPDVPALTPGSQGTLRGVSGSDARRLLRACGADRWANRL